MSQWHKAFISKLMKDGIEKVTSDRSRLSNCSRKAWLFSIPQKLISVIYLLDKFFDITKTSLKHNSCLPFYLKFNIYPFFVIFFLRITVFHSLNKFLWLSALSYFQKFFTLIRLLVLYSGIVLVCIANLGWIH